MVPNVSEKIKQLASKRILILDGAMGTMIQACCPGEQLKGCNDALCLTMPELISGIHEAYLRAGADIIETCSFNSTPVSLADHGLADSAYKISFAAAALARKAADGFSTPDKPRFVAGSMGPTSKNLSFSQNMDDPGKRDISWDELEAAYYENGRGLIDGGADLIIIETVFDTLNAKAAIFAIRRLGRERGIDVPLIVSATVSNDRGRLLSGQSVEAFCVSVLPANPLAVGLNCSFGPEKLKPHIASLSAVTPCLVSAHPNAGLPNKTGAYDESPESMAGHVEEYLREGLVNIVGGCCGSTPAHIAAIAARAEKYAPRPIPALPKQLFLSGLEPHKISREQILSHTEKAARAADKNKFLTLINERNYEDAVDIVRDTIDAGAAFFDVCADDMRPDAASAVSGFLNQALLYSDIARLPVIISSSRWDVIEAALKCLQGKALVNSISLREGGAAFLRRSNLARAYGAAIIVTLHDEEGQAATEDRKTAVKSRCEKLLSDSGFPPEEVIFAH